MGNRAIVIFTDTSMGDVGPAVYLHWNGGPESIYAFVGELDRRQMRVDTPYETARFCQVVGEFFDGDDDLTTLSLGVSSGPKAISEASLSRFDHGDNGIYVVDRHTGTWRRFHGSMGLGRIVEATSGEVKREREKAMESEHYTGILEWFKDSTKGRKIRGG